MCRCAFLVFVVFVVGVVVMGSACPAEDAGGLAVDGGDGSGEETGNVDLGCDADDACDAGLVCDLATATCVSGFDCSVNTTICGFCGNPDVDCGFGAAPAFCDEDAGVCRRSKGACAVCSNDDECGVGDSGLPSLCIDGFCAPGCGPCADGFVCRDGGCAPLPGTTDSDTCDGAILCGDGTACPDGLRCSDLGVCLKLCGGDVDCTVGTICQADGPARNTCVAACPFGAEVVQDGVPQICHGDGRFGDICTTPGSSVGCPPSTECTASGACNLAGCQNDAECPLPRTFCDLDSAACVVGCNDGGDCGAFENCVDNQCRPQGCRGKNTSCNSGEFCCGQELFDDASTCPAPAAEGQCFVAPDPFCRTCDDDDGCSDIDSFGFASHCFELTRQDQATGDDVSLGKFCSVGCRSNDDCPRGIRCITDLPTPDGGTTQGCLESLCAGFTDGR